MEKLAWAVAHLMNSTGNYKNPITIDMLIGKGEKSNDRTLDEKEKMYKKIKARFDDGVC